MKITHTKTPDGRPITIVLKDGMASRLPGTLSVEAVERQLNIYREIDARQKKASNP